MLPDSCRCCRSGRGASELSDPMAATAALLSLPRACSAIVMTSLATLLTAQQSTLFSGEETV